MQIKIIKKEFQWARPLTPLNLSKVTAIALHHMEHLTADMNTIHQWHLQRGWKGFAYNYWIDFDGTIYECRGLNAGGGLYDPHNSYTISIGFQGHYDITKEMPKAQFEAGVQLIKYLKSTIPTINSVEGHKYWQPEKSCPGKYFPLDDMIKMSNIQNKIKDYNDIADWAKDDVLRVVETGIMIGDDQGYFKPNQPLTRQEQAKIICRLLDYIQKK